MWINLSTRFLISGKQGTSQGTIMGLKLFNDLADFSIADVEAMLALARQIGRAHV